ncbi:MAG: hypothetical protein CEE38_23205 [Planctomycetes bacterium B3_Pla]|nr:MAG: hypothetical protein CEE38_23205 [Planctomycetes bacterium B3_Pla]
MQYRIRQSSSLIPLLPVQVAIAGGSLLLVAALWTGALQSRSVFFMTTILIMVSVTVGIANWIKLTSSYFDAFLIVALSQIAFNASQFIMYGVGLLNGDDLFAQRYSISSFKEDYIAQAAALVLGSLSMYMLGGCLAIGASASRGTLPHSHSSRTLGDRGLELKFMRGFGNLCFWVGLVPYLLFKGKLVLLSIRSGYLSIYEQNPVYQDPASALSFLFEPGLVILLAHAAYTRNDVRRKGLFAIGLFIVAFTILCGRRGGGYMLLCALLLVRHRLWRALKAREIMLALLAAVVLLAFVGQIRTADDRSEAVRTSARKGAISLLKSGLDEMGSSASTIIGTLYLVPSDREFEYGMAYGSALLTIVPNVFASGKHPFAERCQLGGWLTWKLAPAIYEAGGGLGFSNIAESYLNFGPFGYLIFLPYGFILATLVRRIRETGSPRLVMAEAIMVMFLPVWARASLINIARPIFVLVVFPLVAMAILKALRRRRLYQCIATPSPRPARQT